MKKFYTLAAALLATGSMLAVNPAAAIKPEARNAMSRATMSEEGLAMVRADEAYNQYVADNDIELPGMQKFSWTDSQGEVWYASLYESGQWSDNFTGWNGAPLYAKVICQLNNRKSGAQRKVIQYLMFAPRYSMWNESAWDQLFGPGGAADKMIPLKYMMSTSDIMTTNWPKGWWVPQASTEANNFYIGQTSSTGGQKADALVIMNSNTPQSSGEKYFMSGSMGYAIFNGANCGPAQNSNLQMSNFDDETSSIDFAFKGTATNANGAVIWTYDYPFSGPAFLPGIASKPYGFEATNVHIVNTGSVKGTDPAYEEITDQEWGPLQRFYVLAVGKGLSYDQTTLEGGEMMWTATSIPAKPVALPGYDNNFNQIRGAVFAANGATQPNGTYKANDMDVSFMQVGSTLFGQTEGTPKAGTFLYGGWRDDYWPWSQNDGVRVNSENYNWYYPYTATNTPTMEVAVNQAIKVDGKTTLNANFTVTTAAGLKAIYHYDPTNYLLTKELDNSGVNSIFNDGENNFNVEAANGIINVTVSNDALVNIYTTNGMLVKSVNAKAGQNVSVDAAQGIYLVKVGGKTVKIAL